MNRILVDLTDLDRWAGTHGGIQRVVYSITKRLYIDHEDHPKIEFITFDEASKRFYRKDFKPVYDRIEQVVTQDESTTNSSAQPEIKSVKEIVKRTLYRNQVFRQWHIATKLNDPPGEHNAPHPITLEESDTVLILGMAWENPLMQKELIAQHHIKNFKLVQMVYDMIICLHPHLHHPANYRPYTSHMIDAIANSDMLLAISESARNDIDTFARQNNLIAPPTKVIRLGDQIIKNGTDLRKPKSINIDSTFIACVGTVEIRKNHTLLYYTYKLAISRGIELPQLIIVGGAGWFTDDIQYLINNDPEVQQKIKIVNGLEDNELAWIYSRCLFTIYPSMYEGWGLPIAESLSYGKVCIASNTSSMPEIGRKLLDYFSPYSTDECLSLIVKYLNKKTLVTKESEIHDKYKATSWKETAREVIKYLEGLH